MPKLTAIAFAKHRGVTVEYVARLLREGRLRLVGDRIDLAEAEAALGPSRRRNQSAERYRERARLERIRGAREALALDRLRASLMDSEEVRKSEEATARYVRERAMGIPDRIAAALAAESDPMRCHRLMTLEIRRALEALPMGTEETPGLAD